MPLWFTMNPGINWLPALLGIVLGIGMGDRLNADELEPAIENALSRMSEALHRLNYTGTLVHASGQQLETLQLTHIMRDGREWVHWVALNGVPQDAQRHSRGAIDFTAGSDSATALPHLWPPLDLQRLAIAYSFQNLGDYRVAERPTIGIAIIPRDGLRYGYRFYLDRDTGLPLKTDLMSESAQPLEQVLFTALTLEVSDVPAVLETSPDPRLQLKHTLLPIASDPWRFNELPTAFVVRGQQRWLDKKGEEMRQFIVNDGLTAISVYIESDHGEGLHGGAQAGAVHAWGYTTAGQQITAVGEAPELTVRRIAEALYLPADTPH